MNLFPKRFLSQLTSPTNFHKLSPTRIASTQYRQSRGYSSDHQPPEKPPPEFPAAPQPDKPSESSEVPSAPDFDDSEDSTQKGSSPPTGDPYGSGAAIPQKGPKSKVRQPHGAQVLTPVQPESDDMLSY